MKAIYYFVASIVFAITTVGCDKHSSQTFNSDRRIVAVSYDASSRDMENYSVKYLSETNVGIDGGLIFAKYTSADSLNISVAIVSSNSVSWGLKFLFDETNYVGDHLQETQEIELPYPQMRQVKYHGFAPVKAWFLSDQEIATNPIIKQFRE